MNIRIAFVWILLIFSLASISIAEVYKWKDTNGTIHYSDTPPTAAKGEIVETRDTLVSTISSTTTRSTHHKPALVASAAQTFTPAPQEISEKDPKRCQEAKERKDFLARDERYKSINHKGSIEFITAEQRKAEQLEVEKQIVQFCR